MTPNDISWQELVTIILTFSMTFLGYKFKDLTIRLRSKRFNLTDHTLFIQLLNTISEVNSWRVPLNRDVFKDALIIKLETWYNTGIELANEVNNKRFSDLAIEKTIAQWATKTINEYNKLWKQAQIPTPIVALINHRHQKKVDLFTSTFARIAHNDIYVTEKHKFIAIFDTLNTLLAETKNDFLELIFMKGLNGDTIGQNYKGVPLNDQEFQQWLLKK